MFSVSIDGNASVFDLKETVKRRENYQWPSSSFRLFDVSDLSIIYGKTIIEQLKNIAFDSKPLAPRQCLSEVFPSHSDHFLHIVVQVPTDGNPN